MTHRSFPPLAAAALVLAALAAGCGDERIGVSDGKRAADESRQPVAKTYWRLHNALANQLYLTLGVGGFTDCADRNIKNSVEYVVDEPLAAKSEKQTEDQFVAMAKSILSTAGWDLKPAGDMLQSAKKNGIEVQLRSFDRTGDDGALVRLVVVGKCTNVGQAKDDIFDAYGGSERDEYRSSSASPIPIPSFLDSDEAP
ncbi:hypothetical protein OG895_23775 [Streptomyces sp. NBC_00201]|uniref:hypothetical protein n=1 Tax=unclassified Streptomyces TaxID=2593676 RepID=UPI00225B4609|nr:MULTISPECIES: hypothetical protein [unclassified Streptomyces]MCX5248191.1 hypothetical protein [Streptomyces sp. NBC_00201]